MCGGDRYVCRNHKEGGKNAPGLLELLGLFLIHFSEKLPYTRNSVLLFVSPAPTKVTFDVTVVDKVISQRSSVPK